MKKTDVDDLHERAHWKRITEKEVAEVMQRIQEYLDDDRLQDDYDLSGLLQTLAYHGALTGVKPEYWELVEKFLVYPRSPYISWTALNILCSDWDLLSKYIDRVKSFLKGENWDENGEVRIQAMGLVGRYFKETQDKESLESLFRIFENKQEEIFERQVALESIGSAFGIDWKYDFESKQIIEDQVVKEIIAKTKQFLLKK